MPAAGKAWGSHRSSDTCQVKVGLWSWSDKVGLVPPSGVESGEDGRQRVRMGRRCVSAVWDQACGILTGPAEKAPSSQQEAGVSASAPSLAPYGSQESGEITSSCWALTPDAPPRALLHSQALPVRRHAVYLCQHAERGSRTATLPVHS